MKRAKIALGDITLAKACQGRASFHPDVVEDYAEKFHLLPPLSVFVVDGGYYLVDGFHRYDAAVSLGLNDVECVIVGTGSPDDASWASIGVNDEHGIRRSRADKRRDAQRALAHVRAKSLTNAAIAAQAKLSVSFVAAVREEMRIEAGESIPPTRIGRDGVERPTKRVGRDEPAKPPSSPVTATPVRSEPPPTVRTPEPAAEPEPPYECPLRDAPVSVFADALRLFSRRWLLATKGTRAEGIAKEELSRAEGLIRGAMTVQCPRCQGAKTGCKSCAETGAVTAMDARIVTRSMEAGR